MLCALTSSFISLMSVKKMKKKKSVTQTNFSVMISAIEIVILAVVRISSEMIAAFQKYREETLNE